jgi:hypothetical protein
LKVFLTTLGLFFFSLAIHFIIWKVRLPKAQIKTLLLVFAAGLILWLIGFAGRFGSFTGVLHVALFYGSLSLCYVITYSAIEADSPTLSLIRFLAEAKAAGRSRSEIAQFVALRPFVHARLAALARSGLIRQEGSRYISIGPRPLSFRLILGFRKVYGPISKGG